MKLHALILAAALAVCACAPAEPTGSGPAPTPPPSTGTPVVSQRAEQWWADVSALADPSTEGRLTGSAGEKRAADYVISRFRAIGLAPAGHNGGYTQTVRFTEQTVDQAASTAALVTPVGAELPLKVGEDLVISAGGAPRPASVDAPLVFVGYGLHMPERGHDDFKGVDLKGKIAVVISGGPAALPGSEKASARGERVKVLRAMGAAGVLTLTTPKQVEIPWARTKVLANSAGMYLADAALRETPDGLLTASFDPAQSARLFAGSGHDFAAIAAAADASAAVPGFALPFRLKASPKTRYRELTADNLVAVLPGNSETLRGEYVVLGAHIDHLGTGVGPDGRRVVYPGAMDDASGVASVLDIATRLKAERSHARSILVVIVTAEEKGLLGSHYFANRPTVPKGSIVADLNFDMPLPFWPLKTVIIQGEPESTLGETARAAAAAQGLATTPDPLPDRNSFTRTDLYSFVKTGVPALAFKFGFTLGTREFEIERDWRATRYHAAGDDLAQPGVLREEAIKLDDYVAAIARRVANDPRRPTWLETSAFKRFAK